MHRLTSSQDREVMGRAMRFDEFQEEFVAAATGQAAVYGLGAEAPTLVQAPNFWQRLEAQDAPVNLMVSDAECFI